MDGPLPVEHGAAATVSATAAEGIAQAWLEVMPHHGAWGHDQAATRESATQLETDVKVVGTKPEPLIESDLSYHVTQE